MLMTYDSVCYLSSWLQLLLLLLCGVPSGAYDLVKDYSGPTFFEGWDFYGGWDNLTLGDVWWLNAQDAFSQRLAYINSANRAVIKVDNKTFVPFNQKRNTVRITTKQSFGVGSLWIIDLVHIPYGCSVWPAFWAKGPDWPYDGEIDIIEAINGMTNNQMALHTTPGCIKAPESNNLPAQRGFTINGDCSTPAGCTVGESSPNSFREGFAATGGGVWATQFDVSGIYMWFWNRANVPASITYADSHSPITDLSQWGPPSASYPASTCNIPQFFSPQQLVLDITLCGIWAGDPLNYAPTCGKSGPTGLCYNDMVVGEGSKFDNAYFEVNYVRAYTTGVPKPTISPTVPLVNFSPNFTTTLTGSKTTSVATFTSAPRVPPTSVTIPSGSDTNTPPSPTNNGVRLDFNNALKFLVLLLMMSFLY